MIVKIAPLGERVVEVNVAAGTSIDNILDVADIDVNGRTIRLNNTEVDGNAIVDAEGAIITLVNKMKGGR